VRPWSEEHNQISTLIYGENSVQFPGAPTGYVLPGDPGVPSTIAPTPLNDFSPRFGLAYSPGWSSGPLAKLTGGPGKTSIRVGAGRFFTAIEGLTVASRPEILRMASRTSALNLRSSRSRSSAR
jgi:hypothetical protein